MFKPKAPSGRDFPSGNSTDTDWYLRMPMDPPLVDPKDEMQPELCEEASATQEPTDLEIVGFHIHMGRYLCWNKSNTMLFG